MASQLFKTKSPERLIAEAAAPERLMKRALSAFDLTCLGIGAIIGAGIFALAGTAAAGEQAHATASLWKTPVLNFIQSYLRTRNWSSDDRAQVPQLFSLLWWRLSPAGLQRCVMPNLPR